MGARATRACLLLLGAAAAWPAGAAAEAVSFAHGTLDLTYTATKPAVATGSSYTARYHAAGDPRANPPYMRKMTSHLPRGMRFDTSALKRCSASDLELALRGPAACPADSRLGGGTVDAVVMERFPSSIEVDVFNNEGEQVMVVRSPAFATVIRGRMADRGSSITFESPTCYPSTPAGCPVDNALQLGSSVTLAPHTRSLDGRVRRYLATPARCPKSRRWRGVIHFWWADGSTDRVVTTHPCKRPRPKSRRRTA